MMPVNHVAQCVVHTDCPIDLRVARADEVHQARSKAVF
jgi:hypothetical protein